jgi:hypothetical protein
LRTARDVATNMGALMGGAENVAKNLAGVSITREDIQAQGLTLAHWIRLNSRGFTQWGLAHELSHAWDAATGWQLSEGLEKFVGAKSSGILLWTQYDLGPNPPPKGADKSFNRLEDFAESVTTYMYSHEAQDFIREHFADKPEFHYANYYETRRALYVDALLRR